VNIHAWPDYLSQLWPGLRTSFLLLVALVALGTPLSLLLASTQRSHRKAVRWTTIGIVEFARGMPSLVLLYLVYFGLPSFNLTLGAFTAASVALAINYAGYTSDAIKSGLDAVPMGQVEASEALGLSRGVTMRRVILPQAVRIITPPMLSWIIVYFQTTSIAFAISVPELMSKAYSIASVNFQYLGVFAVAGLLYAVVSIPGSQLVSALERRQQRGTP